MTTTFEDLQHIDHRVRLQAVARASRVLVDEPAALVSALEGCLVDSFPAVRSAAAEALGRSAAQHAAPLASLIRLAGPVPPDSPLGLWARVAALFGLGTAGRHTAGLEDERWEPAREVALGALSAEESDVRFQALDALSRLGASGRTVVEAVRPCVDDDDEEIAALSAGMLADLGDAASLDAVAARQANAGGALSAELIQTLARFLMLDEAVSADDALRARVIAGLLKQIHRLPEALPACEALGRLGARDAVEPLARQAQGWLTNRFIRVAASAALVRLGDPRGEPALAKCLKARRRDMRGYAMEQIGALKLEALQGPLLSALANPRDEDGPMAARALRLLDSAEARRALKRALDDPRPEVRDEARAAVER